MSDANSKIQWPVLWKLAGLVLLGSQAGLGGGIPSFFPTLQSSGVFSQRCERQGQAHPCPAQLLALSQAVNTGFTVNNGLSLLMGIIIDLFGGRQCAVVGLIIFGVGVVVSSIQPRQGYGFEAGFCLFNISSLLVFMAILSEHIPSLKVKGSWMTFVFTGSWELATMIFPILQLIAVASQLNYLTISIAYALILCIPGVIFLLWCFPTSRSTRPTVTLSTITTQFIEMKTLVKTLMFWVLVVNAVTTVGYNSFFVSTIEQYVIWKGQGGARHRYVTVFGWAQPGIGFAVSLVLAALVPLNIRAKLVKANLAATALAVALLLIIIAFPDHPATIVLGIVFFMAWRTTAFCTLNSSIGYIFGWNMFGRVSGSVFSLAGFLSLAVINSAINWITPSDVFAHAPGNGTVDSTPSEGVNESNMMSVHIIGCCICAICGLAFSLTAHWTLDAQSRSRIHRERIEEETRNVPVDGTQMDNPNTVTVINQDPLVSQE